MTCPGSVRLIASLDPKLRDGSSPAAREGSAAHHVAELSLIDPEWRSVTGQFVSSRTGVIELTEGRDFFEITDEMVDAVQLYRDEVMLYAERPLAQMRVEERVYPVTGRDDIFGTTDATIIELGSWLTVVDFKYGKGVEVSAADNLQMLYYGLGALNAFGDDGLIGGVRLVIVQPRGRFGGDPKRWETTVDRVRAFEGQIVEAEARTRDENAPLVDGPHCRWCPAAGVCPKLRSAVQVAATIDFAAADPAPVLPDPSDPEQIARALKLAPMVEAWAAEVYAMGQRALSAGMDVPGWKLVKKRAHRRWRLAEADVARELSRMGYTDDDIYTDPKLRSPAQIEKLMKKAGPGFTSVYAEVPDSGSLTMVPLSDSRPAALPSAVTDFAALEEENV